MAIRSIGLVCVQILVPLFSNIMAPSFMTYLSYGFIFFIWKMRIGEVAAS